MFKSDKSGLELIKKVHSLIEALEFYHVGKWRSSVDRMLCFLEKNYEIINSDIWLRLFENNVWYLAIVAAWGNKYHVYLPINALNGVFEEAAIQELFEGTDEYQFIQTLERKVDIEPIGEDWEKFFIRMLNHFKKVHEHFTNSDIQCLQKVLISTFNMIGSLVTNCEKVSFNLANSFDYYITAISNSEVLQNENIEKFLDYFGNKTA